VLAGQHTLADVLVPWKRRTLTVLPAGPVPPNPSELLGSQHMGTLVQSLAGEYDHVVIDTPPLLPVTDAAVLATIADGAVLIVRHGRSSRDDLELATQALAAVNARLLGTVLNFIPQRRRGYGYGYTDAKRGDDRKAKAGRTRANSRSSRAQARAKANARHRRHVADKDDFRIDLDSLLAQRHVELGQTLFPPQPTPSPVQAPPQPASQPATSGWFQPAPHLTGEPDADGQVNGHSLFPERPSRTRA
jgi:hypothetical protein